MSAEERKSATARIWLDESGILHLVALGAESTAATVAESFQIVRELTGGSRVPILFDSRDWPKGDPASWSSFISSIESICTAAAVVVNSASAQAMGAFPKLLDDLVIPFRLFPDEEAALSFLRRHLDG